MVKLFCILIVVLIKTHRNAYVCAHMQAHTQTHKWEKKEIDQVLQSFDQKKDFWLNNQKNVSI